MTKLVRSLTAANGKAYGIERAEQYDFRDDGSSFKGYIYKGMPLTQCVSKDYGTFLSIRVDYTRHNFTWEDWRQTDEYNLTDEFNGCSQVDLDKLVDNLEKIIAKVEYLDNHIDVSPYDLEIARQKTITEICEVESRLKIVQEGAPKKWWELREYDLKRARDYMVSLMNNIDREKKKVKEIYTASVRDKRSFIQRKDAGLGCFYIKELEEMFGVANKEV